MWMSGRLADAATAASFLIGGLFTWTCYPFQGHVVMGNNAVSPYQQVIEKTKSLSFRSQVLAMNIEKKQAQSTKTEVSKTHRLAEGNFPFLGRSDSFTGQQKPRAVQSGSNDRLRTARPKNVDEQPSTKALFTRNKPVTASLTELTLSSLHCSWKA